MRSSEERKILESGVRALEFLVCEPDPAAGTLRARPGVPELLLGALRLAAAGTEPGPGEARLAHYLNAVGDGREAREKLLAECFAAALRHGVILSGTAQADDDDRREFLLGSLYNSAPQS